MSRGTPETIHSQENVAKLAKMLVRTEHGGFPVVKYDEETGTEVAYGLITRPVRNARPLVKAPFFFTYQNLTGRVWYVFMLSLYGIIYVTWYTKHLRCVFQELPEPNRTCLVRY